MSFCTRCGAQLGFGRFCTNCGAPVDVTAAAPADPAETQVRLPVVQPDASTGPRFPLYAEPTANPPAPSSGGRRRKPAGSRLLVWAVCLVLLAVLGGVGTWWLIRDDDTTGRDGPGAVQPAPSDRPSDQPSEDPPQTDTPPPVDPGDAEDLTSEVVIQAPAPVAPGQAVDGTPVTYPPTNMFDDDPTTAYRIPGNASGSEIVFTLADEATILEVGLVNGYAKVDGRGANRSDWYASNRKIRSVEWVFDDGTVVSQTLRNTTDVQVVPVDAVRTTSVRLRLLKVSKPGPNPRNTTAISTVRILGGR